MFNRIGPSQSARSIQMRSTIYFIGTSGLIRQHPTQRYLSLFPKGLPFLVDTGDSQNKTIKWLSTWLYLRLAPPVISFISVRSPGHDGGLAARAGGRPEFGSDLRKADAPAWTIRLTTGPLIQDDSITVVSSEQARLCGAG
ncbi:MAG: hypothetical protein DWH73_02285 [Planctomycetota bacterium]|nr:MAG: hypothetical protein DWH73_02285 [Planctomycetota bacterium]